MHRKIALQFFAQQIFTLRENLNKIENVKGREKFSRNEICLVMHFYFFQTYNCNMKKMEVHLC